MLNPDDFVVSTGKPLPVFLLLDTSGSMRGEKLDNLNAAVRTLIGDLSAMSNGGETVVQVAVLSFGPVALRMPLTDVSSVTWRDLTVTGDTPIGGVLREAKRLIEDRSIVPGRAYRPAVILVSDGHSTDAWKTAMKEFVGSGRTSKCDRMAMAIGDDADEEMLGAFVAGTSHEVFHAEDASKIHDFFKFVTMSVTTRTQSRNPNEIR